MGDPNGIGIEIILKAIRSSEGGYTLIGSKAAFNYYQDLYGINNILAKNELIDIGGSRDPHPGAKDRSAAKAAITALDKGIDLIMSGKLKVLVTAPLSKSLVAKIIPGFTGHTEYLAQKFNSKNVAMLGVRNNHRILFYTTHLPLREVFSKINPYKIRERIVTLDRILKDWFGIPEPKILVSGVNPHLNEFSSGEEEMISKGIRIASREGILVEGPISGDAIFNKTADGYLAIYHDQGMIYLKSQPGGTNITVGLPFLRASPLHGTGFDIAGKNLADPTSMIETISIVEKICDRV